VELDLPRRDSWRRLERCILIRAIALIAATAVALCTIEGTAVGVEVAGRPCSSDATVLWETGHPNLRVTGATVDVPGCDDDEIVGLQVITDAGDVPSEMLFAEVVDERAFFDLSPYDIGIEPTTGVRVALVVDGATITDPDVDVLPGDDVRDPSDTDGSDGTAGPGDRDGTQVLDRRGSRDGTLPFTGTAIQLLFGLALGLFLAGSGLLARRRREGRVEGRVEGQR
jgi:hypothetical protein